MTDQEAVEEAVRRTGVERYRFLCSTENKFASPNSRADYLRLAREIASAEASAYPSAARQAASLAGSLWSWAVSGFSMRSEEEKAACRAICAACPNWAAEARRCRICGCQTDHKITMKSEHCPLDPPRW